MKVQLFDKEGKAVIRDKKPVIVEVHDDIQAAAFIKEGFKLIEEDKKEE